MERYILNTNLPSRDNYERSTEKRANEWHHHCEWQASNGKYNNDEYNCYSNPGGCGKLAELALDGHPLKE